MSGQQKTDRRLWWLLVVAAVVSVAWLLATFGLLGSTLEPDDRATIWGLLGDRLMLISLTWGAGMAAIAWGLKRWFDHWVTPSVQLAEEAQVLLRTDVVRELTPKGNVETKVLVGLFNQLVGQREDLRREMDAKVREAARASSRKSRVWPRSCPSSRKASWSATSTAASFCTTTARACSSGRSRRRPAWPAAPN